MGAQSRHLLWPLEAERASWRRRLSETRCQEHGKQRSEAKKKKKWGAPGTDVCSRTGTEKARVGEEVGLGLERWAGTSAHRMPLPMQGVDLTQGTGEHGRH